jgi:APA family basic amino acid/polyamine antiporter
MAEVEFAFPRKATGLVRELGWWSAFSVSMSYTVGSGLNYYLVRAPYWHPGSIVPLAFLLGALPMIFLAYIYTEMGIMMPRSGGDYIYISRALDPQIGFVSNWLYFVANNFATGLLAVIAAGFWAYVVNLMGIITGNADWIAFSLDNTGIAIVAVVIITIYTLLSLFGVRVFRWYVATLVAIGLVGSFIGIGATFYGIANPAYVKESWDATYGAGSWAEVQSVAAANDWSGYIETETAAYGGVAGATVGNFADTFWAYWGATAACYFGGEMKSPRKGFIIGVFGCAIFLTIFYVLTAIGAFGAYGDFISQYTFVYGEGLGDQLTTMTAVDPSLPVFTAPLAHGMPWLQMVFAIIPAMWITNCSGSTLLVGPRQPFAWAFDRFFPEVFSHVNERFHSPHWSVLLSAVIAYLFIPIAIYDVFAAMIDVTFIYIVRCLFGAFTGVTLPYRKPDIWERGFKATVAGIPLLAICGVFAVFLWMWGLMISATWLSIGPPNWDMVYLAFWVAFGAFIWLAFAEYNKRRGITIPAIYGEIPPA